MDHFRIAVEWEELFMKRTLITLIALAMLLTACQAVPTEDAQEVAEPIAEIEYLVRNYIWQS